MLWKKVSVHLFTLAMMVVWFAAVVKTIAVKISVGFFGFRVYKVCQEVGRLYLSILIPPKRIDLLRQLIANVNKLSPCSII